MKKYIYNFAVLALGLVAATSCSPDFAGTEPGNDANPKAVLFQYTPTSADGSYDADTDIRLRIAGNAKTSQVYYKAMKTSTREGMSQEQVINEVVSSGQSVSNPGAGTDVFVTGMQGDYTISAVAVNGDKKVLTETTFFGLTWNDVCTGSIRTRFADKETTAYGYIDNVVLQHNEDNPDNYRLKNPFGTGINLPITLTTSHEEYDASGWANEGDGDYFGVPEPYHYITMPKTALGFSYNGAEAAVGDYTSVRGSDYTYYARLYKNNTIMIYAYWTSAGNIGSGWFEYYPD